MTENDFWGYLWLGIGIMNLFLGFVNPIFWIAMLVDFPLAYYFLVARHL